MVENIDVPVFEAPGELAGQEQEIIADVVAQIETTFAGTGVSFTTERPSMDVEYSTIYIGGDDSAFEDYGDFLGLAETIDVGNLNRADDALVFSNEFLNLGLNMHSTDFLAHTITHEVAHLLGYQHVGDQISGNRLGDYAVKHTLSPSNTSGVWSGSRNEHTVFEIDGLPDGTEVHFV